MNSSKDEKKNAVNVFPIPIWFQSSVNPCALLSLFGAWIQILAILAWKQFWEIIIVKNITDTDSKAWASILMLSESLKITIWFVVTDTKKLNGCLCPNHLRDQDRCGEPGC